MGEENTRCGLCGHLVFVLWSCCVFRAVEDESGSGRVNATRARTTAYTAIKNFSSYEIDLSKLTHLDSELKYNLTHKWFVVQSVVQPAGHGRSRHIAYDPTDSDLDSDLLASPACSFTCCSFAP